MASVTNSRRFLSLVVLGVVLFAFWPSLLGGGSLVSADIVATAAPFDSYQPADFSLENGPGDPINIHSHWASLSERVRAGDAGWWNPELAAGQPSLKGGLPVFSAPYLVVPDWYAPGLVAAIRVLVAIALTIGFLRSIPLHRLSAVVGGVAFGFSGFMVGWMNWPHSSVAALAPGLLWAIERLIRDPRAWRAVPLGTVVALMIWANFPSVTIYVLLGAVAYALVRLVGERRDGNGKPLAAIAAVGVGAGLLALLFAAPHLLGFAEYLDWADTSHRAGRVDDSSAGIAYLMTAVAPAVWGSDAVGSPWFGEGNWVEFNSHVGASVALLASFGFVGAMRSSDSRRRSVALALLVLVGLGVLVAYVGGPLGVLLCDLTGSQGGVMTRAKVLFSLGVAFGAALGVEQLVSRRSLTDLRRTVLWAGAAWAIGLLALLPSLLDWFDAARAAGAFRDTLAVSALPAIAAASTVVLILVRLRDRVAPEMLGLLAAAVVTVELLAFAMPVPTTVSSAERLSATPAHDEAALLLEPGERLAGEGRTFFPSTTQLFDLDDARGQILKSPGYQALLRAVDSDMLTRVGGGTPTYPNIGLGTDPRLPVWDALGIGAWAQFPDSMPIGTLLAPTNGAVGANPSVQRLRGSVEVPEGGLRAVVLEVAPFGAGFLEVTITSDDGTFTVSRWLEPDDIGLASFALLGEHLTVGSAVDVEVSASIDTLLVVIDDVGGLAVGTVAGDDDLQLARIGDVILFDRPVSLARVVSAPVVEPDPIAAAAIVAAGGSVVDRSLPAVEGLASRPVDAVRYDTDRIEIDLAEDSAGVLVVSTAYYPGWEATVDGRPVDIVVADSAFIGVPVGSGDELVVLEFHPRHLRTSVVSLLLGGFLAVGLLLEGRRRGQLRFRPAAAG
jgi:hypothetical protein